MACKVARHCSFCLDGMVTVTQQGTCWYEESKPLCEFTSIYEVCETQHRQSIVPESEIA